MSQPNNLSKLELLALLPESKRRAELSQLSEDEAKVILFDWKWSARANQIQPVGDWRYWLILAGRGWGKTRVGAETVREWVKKYNYVNLIGATTDDAREIMIEGESGILAICPKDERPVYLSQKRRLDWPNGAKSLIFTADEPERLRGKQSMKLWCDEIASWRYPEAFDQAKFGLRLGDNPQAVITTTPRPLQFIKDLIKDPHTTLTRGSTYDNRGWLAPAFFDSIIQKYEGTRLGRQELMAELLEDVPGALWTQARIDAGRVELSQLPKCIRVVVAIDPAVTAGEDSDETGIVVAGIDSRQHIYVIEDGSGRMSPRDWAFAACRLFLKWDCDRIIAEVNNGGDMVEANIRGVHPAIPYRAVRASRGKYVRAEPVAALYEQGRVHHVGQFPKLEKQMCAFVPGLESKSPDRMDALVWAVYDLLLQPLEMAMLTYETGYSISPI